MKSFFAGAVLLLSLFTHASGEKCHADNCLRALRASPSLASAFCTPFVATSVTTATGLPKFLDKCESKLSRISSACSCILPKTSASQAMTTTSALSTSSATSVATQSSCTATVTVGAATATLTVTQTPSMSTTGATCSVSTTSISITITPPATTTSCPASVSTVTLPASTVTALPAQVNIDQSGCPAINGNKIFGYQITCGKLPDSNSFAYATNPGYNIQDCAAQCYANFDNVDCLAATYQPPATAFDIIDDHLHAGTCTFYEFTSGLLDAGSSYAVAVFVGF